MCREPTNQEIKAIRSALLSYYRVHQRDLPWRRSRDAYAIWISEIMLQQTQVDTVMPRYHQFLQNFPTVQALAAAGEQKVCEAWAGLGYYRRARFLHAAAQQVVLHHGGVVPQSVEQLLQLPGIGAYTAGAIASIAYGKAAPLVDGNVVRVLSRLWRLTAPATGAAAKKRLWSLAERLVTGSSPGDFNQALMDLGATVCTPTTPKCSACPLQRHCEAWQEGAPTAYPTAVVKPARKLLPIAMAWAKSPQGVWLERRPLTGLWAGLWELPSAANAQAAQSLAQRLGQRLGPCVAHVTHTLSHRNVEARIYRVARPRWEASDSMQLWRQPLQAPLSALARKAIDAVHEYLRTECA